MSAREVIDVDTVAMMANIMTIVLGTINFPDFPPSRRQ